MIAVMSSTPSSAPPVSDSPNIIEYAPDVDIIEGYLAGNGKIVIAETRFQDGLRAKGFGEKEEYEYILKPYEALYLLHTKRLTVKNKPRYDI